MKLLTRMIELRSEGARAGYIYQKAPIRQVDPLQQKRSKVVNPILIVGPKYLDKYTPSQADCTSSAAFVMWPIWRAIVAA
ncbi:hypothetical protein MGG_17897 [Pyricularia oryzae 70-15]|uniref:Uncharacterized protein n=2 Tax=Pyricularia oryzae TaxID=318829 RepID=G4NL28_PYRO7|nr:uncharacterized protein MGG_17897 [Pyricularia oryzae 70-15]EHA45961.1 hypothetical protein MGG_17897 [Pyricularia oryzae 70-15]ELQ40563.1 hypothetical protein OOU_Y34scaffold00419g7 [Pyricularia oryzae Y34]